MPRANLGHDFSNHASGVERSYAGIKDFFDIIGYESGRDHCAKELASLRRFQINGDTHIVQAWLDSEMMQRPGGITNPP